MGRRNVVAVIDVGRALVSVIILDVFTSEWRNAAGNDETVVESILLSSTIIVFSL